MNDSQELNLIKAFLVEQGARASSDQAIAWENFFRAHDPMIRTIVKKYHKLRHDLEDVVQEVWKVLIRELPKLCYDPHRGSLRNWVATVARHTAGRQARRLSRRQLEELSPEIAAFLPDPGPDPATLSDRRLQREQVRAVLAGPIASLPEVSHRISILRWIEGRTVPEIAALVGLPEDRVWPRLRRAIPKLRVLIRRNGSVSP